MQDIVEKAFKEALKSYIKIKKIRQSELARILGWSNTDLSSSLRTGKAIGKKRRVHILSRLGTSFEVEVNKKIDELRRKPIVADTSQERPSEYFQLECYTKEEQEYLNKVLEIFREGRKENREALKVIIDSFKPVAYMNVKKKPKELQEDPQLAQRVIEADATLQDIFETIKKIMADRRGVYRILLKSLIDTLAHFGYKDQTHMDHDKSSQLTANG